MNVKAQLYFILGFVIVMALMLAPYAQSAEFTVATSPCKIVGVKITDAIMGGNITTSWTIDSSNNIILGPVVSLPPGSAVKMVSIYSKYWDGLSYVENDSEPGRYYQTLGPYSYTWNAYHGENMPEGCTDPCQEGKVGWKLVQSNQDISSQLTGRKCQEFTENTYCISDITVPEAWCVEFSDGTTCFHRQKLINTGESCTENQDGQGVPDEDDSPNKCASEIDALALQCGGTLNIKNFNTETCQGECVKQKCSAGYAALVARCGSFMQIATWDDYTCTGTCSNDPIDPVQEDPETQTPEADPTIDPEDTEGKITNKLLDTIKGDIDKQISQGNDQSNLLANIDKNIASGAKNQANINERLSDLIDQGDQMHSDLQGIDSGIEGIGTGLEGLGSAIDGIGDDISGLEGAIDGLGDEIGQINEGSFAEPTTSDPYANDTEYSFEDRTSQFLNNMKSTGLFSIPNKLVASMPSGGTSTLTISTGETFGGDHTIDFNWLSTGLTILKYIFQIAGMAIGIRIVTLHR